MSTLLSERPQPITAPKLPDRAQVPRSTPPISAGHELVVVPLHPLVVPRASWSLILGQIMGLQILGLIVATLYEWLSRRVARQELASLDDRMLRDIGLDAGTVDYEVRQWFWRPGRDWRN